MKITKGKKESPMTFLIYGPDGLGKSSFGAAFPKPIFTGPESGTDFLDVARFEGITTYSEFVNSLDYLLKDEKNEFETLVVDSLDWLEPLIHEHICNKYGETNLAHAAGGFGAGYKEAFDMQIAIKNKLVKIRDTKKMNLILIAHSQVVPFNDPLTDEPYDRYELKLQESKSVSPRAMWREFVDSVLFLNYDVFTSESKISKTVRADDSGRFLFTTRTPRYDAKRRFYMDDKIEYNLDSVYETISNFYYSKSDNLYKEVLKKAEDCADEEMRKKVLSILPKIKNDKTKLEATKLKLEKVEK